MRGVHQDGVHKDMPWSIITMDMMNIWDPSLQPMVAIPYEKPMFGKKFQIKICQTPGFLNASGDSNLFHEHQWTLVPSNSMGTHKRPCRLFDIQSGKPIPFWAHQFSRLDKLQASISTYKEGCSSYLAFGNHLIFLQTPSFVHLYNWNYPIKRQVVETLQSWIFHVKVLKRKK